MANQYAPKHGYAKHPHYTRWLGMNRRCYNPGAKHFKDYGARGITVGLEWRREAGPKAFCDWAEATYIEGCWLDRKDNDAGYSPENCQWATPVESRANQRCAKPYRKDSNLPTGVYHHYGNFSAQIGVDGKFIYLGTFNTPGEAEEVFQHARERALKGLQPEKKQRSRLLPTGVYPNGKRFRAQTNISGKSVCLGTFDTPKEASEVFEREGRRLRDLAKC